MSKIKNTGILKLFQNLVQTFLGGRPHYLSQRETCPEPFIGRVIRTTLNNPPCSHPHVIICRLNGHYCQKMTLSIILLGDYIIIQKLLEKEIKDGRQQSYHNGIYYSQIHLKFINQN